MEQQSEIRKGNKKGDIYFVFLLKEEANLKLE